MAEVDIDEPEKKRDRSAIFFIGCLFVGLGIGLAAGNAGVGTLIGLGVGFLAMSFTRR